MAGSGRGTTRPGTARPDPALPAGTPRPTALRRDPSPAAARGSPAPRRRHAGPDRRAAAAAGAGRRRRVVTLVAGAVRRPRDDVHGRRAPARVQRYGISGL